MQDVNVDMRRIDQSAYMRYGRELRESGYTYVGGRNRMPLYPLMLSRIYQPGMSDEAFFFRAKVFNVILSILILGGIFWLFTRFISTFLAVNLTLVMAFGVFMYKAGYVQTEILFYGINLLLFTLMWRMLKDPSPTIRAGLGVGVTAGIAHLTKASILPGLLLFIGLGALKWGIRTGQAGRTMITRNALKRFRTSCRTLRPQLSALLAFLLAGATYLMVISPYLITSKRIFGRYFYNVNSTFYIWYESWQEATEGTKAHGDRQGWPDMPDSEIPSLQTYVRDHTLNQILHRFRSGGLVTWERVRDSYGYHIYLYVYGGLLLLSLIVNPTGVWNPVRRDIYPYLFIAAYFAAYGLLYAWYAWIASGNRFVLLLFAPLLFVIGRGIDRLLPSHTIRIASNRPIRLPIPLMLNLIMVGFTISHIVTVLIPNVKFISGAS
jgi:hypothetical protein